ncbi:AraC family transcriptional regulator, partial [Vibrio splendidus]
MEIITPLLSDIDSDFNSVITNKIRHY